MSEEMYANALKTALTEVRNICPEVTRSFIFNKEGTVIAEDIQDTEIPTEKAIHSFQNLIEKADIMGGINTFLVNGNNAIVQFSRINDVYLALSASKKADMAYIQSVARIIIPAVMKLLENIVSTSLKSASPSQNMMAETLMGHFSNETAQVDNKILKEWSKNTNNIQIDEIEIETASGKITRCKVKAISEREFQGKGLIRIPEKIYRTLEVEKGEPVKVKPITRGGK